jgi:hypothetical protein
MTQKINISGNLSFFPKNIIKKCQFIIIFAILSSFFITKSYSDENILHPNFAISDYKKNQLKNKLSQDTWINIFVHGTYGAAFTIMSFINVLQGNIQGTLYQKIQNKNRHKQENFQQRLMDKEGLFEITLKGENDCFIVPFSIIQAYDDIAKSINPLEKNYYYMFGWSGLLSHTERKNAAISFYSLLGKVIQEKFQHHKTPIKIRILAHSHGGNVALMLGAVYEIVYQLNNIDGHNKYADQTLCLLKESLKNVVHEEESKSLHNALKRDFCIDELILYGTPIQEETEIFAFSPFFKRIYNFYSSNDFVQIFDFLSTKTRKSRRLINIENNLDIVQMNKSKIKQIKITVEKNKNKKDIKNQIFTNESDSQFKKFVSKIKTIFRTNFEKIDIKALFRGGWPFSVNNTGDPTHADFWCIPIHKTGNFFYPLPLVVFSPIFIKILDENTNFDPFSIDLSHDESNNAYFILRNESGDNNLKHSIDINRIKMSIENLKDSVSSVLPFPIRSAYFSFVDLHC